MQAAMSESWPVRPAGLDMLMSSLDFWSSPDEPAVISLGKMPGAMQLTRILASAKVVAIIRVRWMKPEMKGEHAWRSHGTFDRMTYQLSM